MSGEENKEKSPTSTEEMLAAGEPGRVAGNHRKLNPIDCQCFLPLPTPCFFLLFLSDKRAAPPGVCGLGRQGCPLSGGPAGRGEQPSKTVARNMYARVRRGPGWKASSPRS